MIPILLRSQIPERRYQHEEVSVTENITPDGVTDASEGWFGRTRQSTND